MVLLRYDVCVITRRQRRAPYRVWVALSEHGVALVERTAASHRTLLDIKLADVVNWSNSDRTFNVSAGSVQQVRVL
jgi:hypothetical protein